jgi:hypothetical protein
VEECTYFWGVNTSWGIDTAESKEPLHQERSRDDFKDGNLFLNVETLRILLILHIPTINVWRYFCKNIQIYKDFI